MRICLVGYTNIVLRDHTKETLTYILQRSTLVRPTPSNTTSEAPYDLGSVTRA
jgi:hypothetical protein